MGIHPLAYMQLQVELLIEHGFDKPRRLRVQEALQRELRKQLDAAAEAPASPGAGLYVPSA